MIKTVEDPEYGEFYTLIADGGEFSISNPNDIPAGNIEYGEISSGNFDGASIADKELQSVWSQNISFKSINQPGGTNYPDGKWYAGDYISTRSHIPGVINAVLKSLQKKGLVILEAESVIRAKTKLAGSDSAL